MSWHYLQGQEAASWEGTSLDGAPSALLRLIPTQGKSCLPDRQMAACPDSPSGMTSQPLTVHPGEDTSTSSQEASPAKTSAQQAREQESQESAAASGVRWRELSARYDRATSGWKTHRCLWTEDLPSSSVTLPRWGMMQDGVLWERTMPEHLTGETGSGYWPTPKAMAKPLVSGPNGSHGIYLAGAVMLANQGAWPINQEEGYQIIRQQMWPTPQASEATQENTGSCVTAAATGGVSFMTLTSQTVDARALSGGQVKAQIPFWPTSKQQRTQALWHTPTAQDAKNSTLPPSQISRHSIVGQLLKQGQAPSGTGGALNPTWVEWLMGWPLGWTSMECMQGLTWAAWQRAYQTGQSDCTP